MTQGQLAELANTRVEQVTGKPGAMDADYIGKLERGIHRWPNQQYRAALRLVLRRQLDAELGFFSTRSRAATVERNPRYVDGGDDVERKTFLRVLAGSVAGLAFSDPLGDFAASATTGGTRRVGQTEVDQVRHLARMFARQDHVYGSALSSDAVVVQLSNSAQLLEGRFSQEAVRRQLFSAVAELADLAGGMSLDDGTYRQAERCFRFAVGCATEGGDWSLRARALSGLTSLAVHQGRTDDALSYSEVALVRADRLTPIVRTIVHTKHARALGLSGGHREADCITAVRLAEDHFILHTGDESDAPTLRHYSPAHLERDIGRALLHLAVNGGAYINAQQRLSAAVDQFPQQQSRGKTLTMANLAHLTMARDDPAHAVTLGNATLNSLDSLRSDRVFEALRQLRTASLRHRSVPGVRDLTQRVDKVLRATI